jgi:hypothetical protein
VKRRDEIRHLRQGADPGERPQRHEGTVLPATVTASDPQDTLVRARSVLLAVLTAPGGWSAKRPPRNLPQWFVDACAPDVDLTPEEVREQQRRLRHLSPEELAREAIDTPWSLADWLHWFEGERYWFWWDARITGDREIIAEYVVYEWPAPTGSLVWLWRASGAVDVDVF